MRRANPAGKSSDTHTATTIASAAPANADAAVGTSNATNRSPSRRTRTHRGGVVGRRRRARCDAAKRLSDGDDPCDHGDNREDHERHGEHTVRVLDLHRCLAGSSDERTIGLGDDAGDLSLELVECGVIVGQLDPEDVVEVPDLVSVPLVKRRRENDERCVLDEFDLGAGDADNRYLDRWAGRRSGILAFDELRHLLGCERDERDLVAHVDAGCVGVLGIDDHLASLSYRGSAAVEDVGPVDLAPEPVPAESTAAMVNTSSGPPAGATNMYDDAATASTWGSAAMASKYSGETSTSASAASIASRSRGYTLWVPARAPTVAASTTAPTIPVSSTSTRRARHRDRQFPRDQELHGVRPAAHLINLRASDEVRQGATPLDARVPAPAACCGVRAPGSACCRARR